MLPSPSHYYLFLILNLGQSSLYLLSFIFLCFNHEATVFLFPSRWKHFPGCPPLFYAYIFFCIFLQLLYPSFSAVTVPLLPLILKGSSLALSHTLPPSRVSSLLHYLNIDILSTNKCIRDTFPNQDPWWGCLWALFCTQVNWPSGSCCQSGSDCWWITEGNCSCLFHRRQQET